MELVPRDQPPAEGRPRSAKQAAYADPGRPPVVLPPDFGAVPPDLRAARRWVLWQLEWKRNGRSGGKWDKVPYGTEGRRAKTNDPATWATFEAVEAAYQRGGWAGIGFVLGDGFVGIDLDEVRNPDTGDMLPGADRLMRELATYFEVSPSGTGVKAFGKGDWNASWHKTQLPGGGEIEGYSSGRYFTVTGRPGRGSRDMADIQRAADALGMRLARLKVGQVARPGGVRSSRTPVATSGLDDEAVLARAGTAANGAKFSRLMAGDTGDYAGDQSRADLALCDLLAFWTGGDTGQIDRLFRRSRLMRPKWDERHGRGGRTYGQLTIGKAIAGRTDFFSSSQVGRSEHPSPPTEACASEQPEAAEIVIGTDQHRVNDQAAAALAREPDLYQRGGSLVHVIHREPDPEAAVPVRRPDGAVVIRPVAPATLRERLSRVVRFMKASGTGDDARLVPAHPPDWCVSAVHARGEWAGMPRLNALLPYPVLAEDGGILCNGYHARIESLVRLTPGLEVNVPHRPSGDEVSAAVRELCDPLADFPFAGPAHRAALVAGLLTPLAWFLFDGPAPLFLIDKNVRGAGAGLLADVVALTLTGRRFPVMGYTPDREELRKQITTLAVEGERLVLLDNLTGRVGNDVLARALTAAGWKDRVLGGNTSFDGPLDVVWFGTGNNVQLVSDLGRRVCPIRMESREERPEERTGFCYPDLRGHVRSVRARLLSAALTILRGWVVTGRPSHGLKTFGSYEGWSGVVREACVFAGLGDPAATRETILVATDPDEVLMPVILGGLSRLDPEGRGLTASAIVARLKPVTAGDTWLAEVGVAVEELCGKLDPRALGCRFREYIGRNFGGLILARAGEDRVGAVRWRVRPIDGDPVHPTPPARFPAGDAEDAGSIHRPTTA